MLFRNLFEYLIKFSHVEIDDYGLCYSQNSNYFKVLELQDYPGRVDMDKVKTCGFLNMLTVTIQSGRITVFMFLSYESDDMI